jgi:hypothetical protein
LINRSTNHPNAKSPESDALMSGSQRAVMARLMRANGPFGRASW